MNAQLEVPYLEAEVGDRLRELIERTDVEIDRLKRTRTAIEKKIKFQTRKRQLWAVTLQALAPESAAEEGVGGFGLRPVPDGQPTKPRAVLAFLSEHPRRAFRLIEIRHALIARGWINDDQRSAHALEVAVRALHTRGQVERPQRGIYQIAPSQR